jgi:hypothetical protein
MIQAHVQHFRDLFIASFFTFASRVCCVSSVPFKFSLFHSSKLLFELFSRLSASFWVVLNWIRTSKITCRREMAQANKVRMKARMQNHILNGHGADFE